MENPHTEGEVIPRLSLPGKQLTRAWLEDYILSSDLSRAATHAGSRSPVDEIVIAMGLIAELYSYGLAYNRSSERDKADLGLDFEDICRGLSYGHVEAIGNEGYMYPFPSSGLLVMLAPTELGLRVAERVDPDLDGCRRVSAVLAGPALEVPSMGDLSSPGSLGRILFRAYGSGPWKPEAFFRAAFAMGYEDHRDQAVLGFGTLTHLLATGALVAEPLKAYAFVADGRG